MRVCNIESAYVETNQGQFPSYLRQLKTEFKFDNTTFLHFPGGEGTMFDHTSFSKTI